MSAQKLIRGSLAFLFALTATGTALADGTVRSGYRDSIVKDACTPVFVSGASYRDSVARLETTTVGVLAAKSSNGYRDANARIPAETTARQVALAAPLVCRN
jgi:hypothetical protein